MGSERGEEDIRRAILEYLAEHPQAMDTLEGIAAWWLMRQQVRTEVSTLRKAVERLVAEGLLEEVDPGQNAHYRRGLESLE
jgi:Fe2+ or Zn2+ uptake regulation protein